MNPKLASAAASALASVALFSCTPATPPPEQIRLDGGHPTTTAYSEKAGPAVENPFTAGPAVDVPTWSKAYENAGRPRVLVLCGTDTGRGPAGGEHAIGGGLDPFDPSGDALAMSAGIEQALLSAPGLRLVHAAALSDADREEVRAVRDRDQAHAIELLSQKLQADIVFVCHLIPAPNPAARYRVVLETVDAGAARTTGGFAFDWKLDDDGGVVRMYASRVAEKFTSQFVAQSTAPARDYRVVLLGVKDITVLHQADATLRTIPGVVDSRIDDYSQSVNSAATSVSIRFKGSPVDLLFGLQNVAVQQLGLVVDGCDLSSSTLTLIARPKRRWEPLMSGPGPVRDAFATAYHQAGSPRIAVVLGEPADDVEVNKLVRQGNPGAPAAAAPPQTPETQRLGAELDGPLSQLITTLKDYDKARADGTTSPGKMQAAQSAMIALQKKLLQLQLNDAGIRQREESMQDPGPAPVQGPGQVPTPPPAPLQPPAGPAAPPTQVAVARNGSPVITKGFVDAIKRLDDIVRTPQEVVQTVTSPLTSTQQTIGQLQQVQTQITPRTQAYGSNTNRIAGGYPARGQANRWTDVSSGSPGGQQPVVLRESPRKISNEGLPQATNRIENPTRRNSDIGPGTAVPVAVAPLVSTDQLQAAMTKRMLGLDLQIADEKQVHRNLVKEASDAVAVYHEDQLARLLLDSQGVNVLVIGVPAGKSGGMNFRAVRTSDGAVLASEVWPGDGTDVNAVADALAGSLIDQLWGVWSHPSEMTLRVENAKTLREMTAITATLKDRTPGIVSIAVDASSTNETTGIATCRVVYTCTHDQLVTAVTDASQKLPFNLDTAASTDQTMILRLREGF